MTIPPTARTIAAICVAALLAGGCQTANDPPPPPEAADDNGANDGDASSPLTAAAAADLYVRWQRVIAELPPMDRSEVSTNGVGEGIVTPDSPAEAFLIRELEQVAESGVVRRGRINAETLDITSLAVDAARAEICAHHDVANTDLATGEISEGAAVPDRYVRSEITFRRATNVWTVEDATAEEPRDCVPPSVAAEIHSGWEAYIGADVEWLRRGAPGDDLGQLADLTTGAKLRGLEQGIAWPQAGTWVEAAGISFDLQLHAATSTRVEGDWCLDATRNPDAGTHRPDGSFTQATGRRLDRGIWALVDGSWRLESHESVTSEDDGAPEEHRCF